MNSLVTAIKNKSTCTSIKISNQNNRKFRNALAWPCPHLTAGGYMKEEPIISGWCPDPQELVGCSAGHDVALSTWQSAPNQALIHKPRRCLEHFSVWVRYKLVVIGTVLSNVSIHYAFICSSPLTLFCFLNKLTVKLAAKAAVRLGC